MKKIYIALIIFTIVVMLSSMVFAATTETFEVVDDQVCTIKINDYSEFEKKMTSYDLDKRQVTIQLKITNNSVETMPTGEVMLVLDNSNSMKTETTPTRQELVYNSAKSLITKMLKDNNKLKVGIVSFSSNTDISKWGQLDYDAALISNLSNDATALNNAIDTIATDGPRTDLDAGISLASTYFSSENNNKYIIILTDGVPNLALNLPSGDQKYGDAVINKTKATLESLKNKYNIITMLTGVDENTNAQASNPPYTFGHIVEKAFGTTANPTAGKFYYIDDDKIEKTIVDDIYADLLPQSQSITDIKINDFFPKEIVDNFDFAYVSKPTKGTISQSIDDVNKIVWSIDELASGETATVSYTLTLKNNYSSSIINKILDTNEKVDITYKDFDGTDKIKTSDETPKVRIRVTTTEDKKKEDKTVAPTIIPKTGKTTVVSVAILLGILAVSSGTGILKINNDIKKQK